MLFIYSLGTNYKVLLRKPPVLNQYVSNGNSHS